MLTKFYYNIICLFLEGFLKLLRQVFAPIFNCVYNVLLIYVVNITKTFFGYIFIIISYFFISLPLLVYGSFVKPNIPNKINVLLCGLPNTTVFSGLFLFYSNFIFVLNRFLESIYYFIKIIFTVTNTNYLDNLHFFLKTIQQLNVFYYFL